MFVVRPETPSDIPAIGALLDAAFKDHPHSNQTERLIVEALRAAGVLTVSLVAQAPSGVIGCVAFSPVVIDGEDRGWLGLGPVAVHPGHQRRGVGTALITSGLGAVREAGARGCVVLGDPKYYVRFGFAPDSRLVLDGFPPEYFMALPFLAGDIPAGKAAYHPAFATCG